VIENVDPNSLPDLRFPIVFQKPRPRYVVVFVFLDSWMVKVVKETIEGIKGEHHETRGDVNSQK